jgi:hypothetical protein
MREPRIARKMRPTMTDDQSRQRPAEVSALLRAASKATTRKTFRLAHREVREARYPPARRG